MSGWKKLAAASAAGGAGLDVDEVFSTYLYTGNGSSQTITNGIDLAGEGGMVWVKNRVSNTIGGIGDTERGTYSLLAPSESLTPLTGTTANITAFNSDGFGVGTGNYTLVNYSGHNYASWTFRKAPKFFDVVTYTGNETGTGSSQTISHDLGTDVGMMIVKCLSDGENWRVWHRNLTSGDYYLQLNGTQAERVDSFSRIWNATAPTSTHFTVGSDNSTNGNGKTYVAYLFAHNDDDGEFGPDGDQDIIKCGSYTGNSSGVEIDLGFEPQWFMCKKTNGGSDWQIFDTMRGMHFNTTTQSVRLSPNTSGAETSQLIIGPSPTGVSIPDASDSVNISGGTYIYMAIRRGPLAQPESGTEVFDTVDRYAEGSLPTWNSGFVTDMALRKRTNGSDTYVYARLMQGKELAANASSIEATTGNSGFDYMQGWGDIDSAASGYKDLGWNWKRAPGFFDVVTYSGNSTSGRTVDHNLGVVPEMFWVKSRSGTYAGSSDFKAYHKDVGNTASLSLQGDYIPQTSAGWWNNTTPTDTAFTLGNGYQVNQSGAQYIAYLFASLPGISKVGSFSHTTGFSTDVGCGFSSGARFILFKKTSSTGDWWVHDTERGIVASAVDPYLKLNTTDAEGTNFSLVEPLASGFTVTSALSTGSYIFYAIA